MTRLTLTCSVFILSCCSVLAGGLPRPVAPPDSVGVIVKQNKTYVRHRVAPGETLYGLARRYNVKVEQIMAANPTVKGELIKGSEVLIPRQRAVLPATGARPAAPAAAAAAPAAVKALPTDAAGNRVYKVQPGQTLFAIARKFGVSPTALQHYNSKDLPANGAVRVGQTLIIAPAGAAAVSAAPKPAPVAATPKPAAPTARPERDDEAEKERAREAEREKERAAREAAATTPAPAPASSADDDDKEPTRASEIVKKVTESGVAAVIEGGNSEKYLALHKTAPVGTIMMVRNIMNGRVVYVRVIGKLPDTGDNASILLRLSRRAVAVLGTPDQRFRVETSYLPE